jgi:hypothetical protein
MMPECGDKDCTDCVIVWEGGKRFVRCKDKPVPFDSFVVETLATIAKDVAEIKAGMRGYPGLVP